MALLEILIESGLIDQDELEQRRSEIAVNLRRSFVARCMTVAVHESGYSKYALFDTVEIDCENRLHLCKVACSRLSFALSREDVEEGALRWDSGALYMIARGENGYCAHLDPVFQYLCEIWAWFEGGLQPRNRSCQCSP